MGTMRMVGALAGALLVGAVVTRPAEAACTLDAASYAATKTFTDSGSIGATSMTIAWDGSYYWTSSGGSSSGYRLSKYTSAGSRLGDYASSRDFRSVFTLGDGVAPIYERAYASRNVDRMVSDGVFSSAYYLSSGSLDSQSSVVFDDTRDQFVAMYNGRVDVWNSGGSWVKAITLGGYGSGSELSYPQNRGVATSMGCYLTYADGRLSVWNDSGVREDTATLTGAGTSFDSYFSLSYANGMVWIIDVAYGTWRGFDVGTIGCDDDDGDGHADPACGGDDCNDANATIYPGAPEICDGLDNDCDGATDDGAGCCDDVDGDGYDEASCGGDDCDDGDPAIHPGAAEVCNGADDDCDGLRDEGMAYDYYYRDTDGDSYGDPDALTLACAAPAGYVDNDDDCDDFDGSVYPGAPEVCDEADNDCDGRVDDADPDLDPTSSATWYADADGDTYGDATASTISCFPGPGEVDDPTDCDDTDPAIHPGATEVCSGLDEDCDGAVDDADDSVDPSTFAPWFSDADTDGYGDPAVVVWACDPPVGAVDDSTDCNDAVSTIHPGATEVCNDLDDDCDALIDDADPSLDGATRSTFHPDGDGDGYGASGLEVAACDAPAGYLPDDSDCDDGAASIHPGATEVCNDVDDDCDSLVDDADAGLDAASTATWAADSDGDGFGDPLVTSRSCDPLSGEVADTSDCDDTNAEVNPDALEVCNGLDDDCDTLIDDADPSVDDATAVAWYGDGDGDGFGDPLVIYDACTPPSGTVADATDCDDADPAVFPGALEVCNGLDDDCDALIDAADPDVDPASYGTWYADLDGDGFGDLASTVAACGEGPGVVADATDCDDTNDAIHPDASEVCNGLDDDCDGLSDDADDEVDGTTYTEWHVDADGDGYGDPIVYVLACDAGSGHVLDATDCDDADLLIHPGGTEACNDLDDDCDGITDEDVGYISWWADADGDGYGDPTVSMVDCAPASGFLDNADDCDDTDPAVNPGGAEVCNDADDDCDGLVDDADDSVDASTGLTFYSDGDGDGYGDAGAVVHACDLPLGATADGSDCDDTAETVYPGAPEVCDGIDQDCDGVADDGASDAVVWFADADGDTYGDPLVTATACAKPDGHVADFTDCDDSDPAVWPGAPEVAYDGIDQDCDGLDSDDLDGDGWSGEAAGGPDCFDRNDAVHPGAIEVENGVDDDCDGLVDETTDGVDDDGDGFTEHGGDCDDGDPGVHPAADESCDGVDEDCDGTTDEGTTCFDDDGDGASEEEGDCVDGDPAIGPEMKEMGDNGIDDDCDGVVDGGAVDADADGFGPTGGDCDEGRSDVHPGAVELEDGRDNDCDGLTDEGTDVFDDDGDGWTEDDGDCDDDAGTTHPEAPEVLGNGVDDDCDGLVDEGTDNFDDDGDGYSEDAGDCDDTDPGNYPGAPELADGRDNDCDGVADDGTEDLDGDGVSAELGDCDDLNGWVHPTASELCDGLDNDCDGEADEDCGGENADTGLTGDTGEGQPKACGCATGRSSGWIGALGLVALLRRRVRSAPPS